MLIYNVTAHVETSIEKAWLEWMKEFHIPEMQATKNLPKLKSLKSLRIKILEESAMPFSTIVKIKSNT